MPSRSARARFLSLSWTPPSRRQAQSWFSTGRISLFTISAVSRRIWLMRSDTPAMGWTFIGMALGPPRRACYSTERQPSMRITRFGQWRTAASTFVRSASGGSAWSSFTWS
jgi:hypothetical protein